MYPHDYDVEVNDKNRAESPPTTPVFHHPYDKYQWKGKEDGSAHESDLTNSTAPKDRRPRRHRKTGDDARKSLKKGLEERNNIICQTFLNENPFFGKPPEPVKQQKSSSDDFPSEITYGSDSKTYRILVAADSENDIQKEGDMHSKKAKKDDHNHHHSYDEKKEKSHHEKHKSKDHPDHMKAVLKNSESPYSYHIGGDQTPLNEEKEHHQKSTPIEFKLDKLEYRTRSSRSGRTPVSVDRLSCIVHAARAEKEEDLIDKKHKLQHNSPVIIKCEYCQNKDFRKQHSNEVKAMIPHGKASGPGENRGFPHTHCGSGRFTKTGGKSQEGQREYSRGRENRRGQSLSEAKRSPNRSHQGITKGLTKSKSHCEIIKKDLIDHENGLFIGSRNVFAGGMSGIQNELLDIKTQLQRLEEFHKNRKEAHLGSITLPNPIGTDPLNCNKHPIAVFSSKTYILTNSTNRKKVQPLKNKSKEQERVEELKEKEERSWEYATGHADGKEVRKIQNRVKPRKQCKDKIRSRILFSSGMHYDVEEDDENESDHERGKKSCCRGDCYTRLNGTGNNQKNTEDCDQNEGGKKEEGKAIRSRRKSKRNVPPRVCVKKPSFKTFELLRGANYHMKNKSNRNWSLRNSISGDFSRCNSSGRALEDHGKCSCGSDRDNCSCSSRRATSLTNLTEDRCRKYFSSNRRQSKSSDTDVFGLQSIATTNLFNVSNSSWMMATKRLTQFKSEDEVSYKSEYLRFSVEELSKRLLDFSKTKSSMTMKKPITWSSVCAEKSYSGIKKDLRRNLFRKNSPSEKCMVQEGADLSELLKSDRIGFDLWTGVKKRLYRGGDAGDSLGNQCKVSKAYWMKQFIQRAGAGEGNLTQDDDPPEDEEALAIHMAMISSTQNSQQTVEDQLASVMEQTEQDNEDTTSVESYQRLPMCDNNSKTYGPYCCMTDSNNNEELVEEDQDSEEYDSCVPECQCEHEEELLMNTYENNSNRRSPRDGIPPLASKGPEKTGLRKVIKEIGMTGLNYFGRRPELLKQRWSTWESAPLRKNDDSRNVECNRTRCTCPNDDYRNRRDHNTQWENRTTEVRRVDVAPTRTHRSKCGARADRDRGENTYREGDEDNEDYRHFPPPMYINQRCQTDYCRKIDNSEQSLDRRINICQNLLRRIEKRWNGLCYEERGGQDKALYNSGISEASEPKQFLKFGGRKKRQQACYYTTGTQPSGGCTCGASKNTKPKSIASKCNSCMGSKIELHSERTLCTCDKCSNIHYVDKHFIHLANIKSYLMKRKKKACDSSQTPKKLDLPKPCLPKLSCGKPSFQQTICPKPKLLQAAKLKSCADVSKPICEPVIKPDCDKPKELPPIGPIPEKDCVEGLFDVPCVTPETCKTPYPVSKPEKSSCGCCPKILALEDRLRALEIKHMDCSSSSSGEDLKSEAGIDNRTKVVTCHTMNILDKADPAYKNCCECMENTFCPMKFFNRDSDPTKDLYFLTNIEFLQKMSSAYPAFGPTYYKEFVQESLCRKKSKDQKDWKKAVVSFFRWDRVRTAGRKKKKSRALVRRTQSDVFLSGSSTKYTSGSDTSFIDDCSRSSKPAKKRSLEIFKRETRTLEGKKGKGKRKSKKASERKKRRKNRKVKH